MEAARIISRALWMSQVSRACPPPFVLRQGHVIQYMEALTQFLASEIRWTGEKLTHTAGAVLMELCRKAKANDPAGAIQVKLEYLGSHGPRQASPRAVDDAVALLLRLGLITRERRRPHGARLKEEVALTRLNPMFIDIALAWHGQRISRRAAGKRGHLAYPPPMEIGLPMTFIPDSPDPRGLRMATTPKKDTPSGNPMPMRVSEGPVRKFCALQYAKFAETGIHTPLAPAVPREPTGKENLVKGVEGSPRGGQPCLSTPARGAGVGKCLVVHGLEGGEEASSPVSDFAARERRFPLLPPATAGRGGGAQFGFGPVLEGIAAPQDDFPVAGGHRGRLDGWSRSEAAMRDRCTDSTRLAVWIMRQNGSNRDHLTRLVTIRCSAEGRYSGGELQIGKHSKGAESIGKYSGLSTTQWDELFKMVYARSQKKARLTDGFIGESLFAGPREGSRIILLDDVKSMKPIFNDFACAILETSAGNFQHLYASDRDMSHDERHITQRALYKNIGCEADAGALSGHQAHRWPGSVNLKPSRKRFWTRLVHLSDGKKIEVSRLLANSQDDSNSSPAPVSVPREPRARASDSGLDRTASGRDWGRAIGMLSAGRSAVEVEAFLHHSARQPGRQARDESRCAHYVDTTMAALRREGFLPKI